MLVVTQPDRPAGRGHRLRATPVKLAAAELGIATIEPERLRDALGPLAASDADLFAVASYGKIVPQAALDIPRLGALNVHPSLLPLYRGATPLQSQLRDGVALGGVTIIAMDAGMDTGDIVLQVERPIGATETYGELHDRFADLGAELLGRAVAMAFDGSIARTPQRSLDREAHAARTFTRPLRREDTFVDWAWPARRVVNTIRSLSPAPGARAHLDGESEPVKILLARVAEPNDDPMALRVTCGDGVGVIVERLVPPNRPATSGVAYRASTLARAASKPS
ncbi:MAG: methionyl-tRNA formyltransferase [Vulcanimicrobiaceae bacterium]